jgi:hypothetical protein
MRYEFADHEFTRVSFTRVGRHGRVTPIKTEIDLISGTTVVVVAMSDPPPCWPHRRTWRVR